MARRMFTPRTGKRSKKQKKARKLKQDEEENVQANEAVNTSPESGAKDAGSRDGESGAPESRENSKNVDEPDRSEDGGSDHKGEARSGDDLVPEICKGEDEEGEEEKEEGTGQEEKSDGEEESDESPEDISLTKGKVMAMEQQKNEGEEIKRVKATEKEKRKKKNELFKKQKDAKLLRKVTKFSEEGLEIVARKMAEERVMKKAEKKKKKRQKEVLEACEDQPMSSKIEVGGVRIIPLGEENSREEKMVLRAAAGYEAANDFLTRNLYGGRQKRIPALTLQAKRYCNQPAKNFVQT